LNNDHVLFATTALNDNVTNRSFPEFATLIVQATKLKSAAKRPDVLHEISNRPINEKQPKDQEI